MSIVYLVFQVGTQTIAYNSFNRYKFEYWELKNCHQITTKYSYPKYTILQHTKGSNRTLSMYQDTKKGW